MTQIFYGDWVGYHDYVRCVCYMIVMVFIKCSKYLFVCDYVWKVFAKCISHIQCDGVRCLDRFWKRNENMAENTPVHDRMHFVIVSFT